MNNAVRRIDQGRDQTAEQGNQPQETLQPSFLRRLFSGRLRLMSTERAQAQGLFIPSWWLAILLIPAAYGVWSAGMSLSRIETKVDAADARVKAVETQGRLNDEHTRQLEIEIAKTQGAVEALAKFRTSQKEGDQ